MSLEDFIKQNFNRGVVHFNCDSHVTPDGVVRLYLVSTRGYSEFEGLVVNNIVNVIENNYVKN